MAEPTPRPVYDPTGKHQPPLPEPDPPTGTDIVPPDRDTATEPPPRREGVVSNPDGGPEVGRP
jgi:hypothetical protein